ncbi:hypothetical protein B0H11DRAFT_2338984 [Mycena galericulata]|nr:hypothetical protein B0H11DRAFT_2338984 [Mycena galericulata]
MTRRACSSNPLAARVIWSTATQARLGIVEISAIFRPTKNKYSVTGDVWERSPGQAVRMKHARHRPSLLLAAAGGRRDVGTTRKPRPAAGWECTGAHRSHGLIPERLRQEVSDSLAEHTIICTCSQKHLPYRAPSPFGRLAGVDSIRIVSSTRDVYDLEWEVWQLALGTLDWNVYARACGFREFRSSKTCLLLPIKKTNRTPLGLRTSAHRAVQDAGVNVLKVYFVRRTSLDSCNCNWNGTHLGRREGDLNDDEGANAGLGRRGAGCMVFRERMKIDMEFEWISCIFELEEEQGSTSFSATAHQTTDLTHLLDSLQYTKGHADTAVICLKQAIKAQTFKWRTYLESRRILKLRWPGLRVTSLKVNM